MNRRNSVAALVAFGAAALPLLAHAQARLLRADRVNE